MHVYDPNATIIAEKTFTLPAGFYYRDFVIREECRTSSVCVGATDTPGYSCVGFTEL